MRLRFFVRAALYPGSERQLAHCTVTCGSVRLQLATRKLRSSESLRQRANIPIACAAPLVAKRLLHQSVHVARISSIRETGDRPDERSYSIGSITVHLLIQPFVDDIQPFVDDRVIVRTGLTGAPPRLPRVSRPESLGVAVAPRRRTSNVNVGSPRNASSPSLGRA